MFKKPTRRFRPRTVKEEGDEEGVSCQQEETAGEKVASSGSVLRSDESIGEEEAAVAPALSRRRAPRAERMPGSGLLSFEEEEKEEGEEEQFRIKKPAMSAVIFNVQKKINASSSYRESDQNREIFQCELKLSSSSNDECESEDDAHLSDSEDSLHSASSHQSVSFQEKQHSSAAVIPDARIIRAARIKRQLARAGGDYIPLDVLVDVQQENRDPDSEDEADDHKRRINFAPKTNSLKERMTKEIYEESEESDDDDDDTQKMWEEQQLRKAVRISQGSDLDVFTSHSSHYVKIKREPLIHPPVNLEIIKKGLSARLKSFQEIHQSHQREYEKIVHDIESAKSVITDLEQSSSAANYKFYKTLKTYTENVTDCLNEKISMINELELAMQQLLHQKAQTLLMRRQDDLRSEAAFIQQLTSNSGISANGSMDIGERTHLEECESRRAHRRQVRESSEQLGHYEGMSSDDEMSPVEATDFQKGRDSILNNCQTVFEDVLEEFCSIRCILLKFQEWREKYPDSYYGAYISLCLPALLNPLIRIRLIGWNPLEEYTDLEQASWYREIKTFSLSGNGSESVKEDHSDVKMLTTVLMKTVMPKITEFVECVWDPLSSSQTNNLVQLCKNILKECDANKATEDLLNSIVLRLKKTIDEDVYIPLYSKSALDDKSLLHSKFQERQFWSALKLLSNIFCWDGLIQEEVLYELGLDKLLNRYLLLVLLYAQPGPSNVEKCRKVVECFPERWFKNLKSGSTLPQLAKFSKHLMQSSDIMYQHFRTETNEMVLLLMKIKALDFAEVLIKKYELEHLKSEMKK